MTEILRRNTEFWPASAVPEPGSRFTFGSSPVIFEYYPGEGLQLQPLASFGKANAAWRTCRSRGDRECPALRALLDGMLALAAQRAGFTAWEYYFDFEGGVPPWISGMAQATGVQALSRAYRLTGDSRYRAAASAALGAFETAPPLGVAIPATGGTHYLQYSYAPGLFIFNGFTQTLVGLFDYQSNTGDERGAALFRSGDGHGRWLIPQSDTGSWSLYSLGGPLSTLEYHTLLRDFLRNLCGRTDATVYCTTADRFTAYLAAPPAPPPAPPAPLPASPAPPAPPAAVAVAGVATPPQALTPPAATRPLEAARPALRARISPGRHVLTYTVARRSHLRARVQARRAGGWRTVHVMRGLPGSPGRHRVRLRDTPRLPWRVVLERTSRAGRVLERVVATGR